MSHSPDSSAPAPRSAVRTIARNTLFGVGAQFALRVVSFLFNLLIIRKLGGAEFGQYNIVLDWAALFSVIGDLGINQYLAREIARNPNKVSDLFWDTVVLRFLLAIITSIVTVIAAIWNSYDSQIILAIALFTSTYFLQALLAPLSSILTGNERLDITSALGVISQVVFMVFAGMFLFMGLDFVWLVVAALINAPIMLALHLWFVRRNRLGPPRLRINPSMWWVVIKAGLPFAVVQLSLSFAFRVDTIILSTNQVSHEHIGWYKAVYNLVLTMLTVTRSFNDAILPTLAREHALNPETVRPWYYRSVKVMLFIGLPIAVGGMLTAGQITAFLYEPSFAPAALSLAILVWDIPVVMYHSFCGNMTTSIRRERSAARIYGSLGIINVLLNLLLIPRFGIIGSSFATVLTDLAGAAQFYFLFRHEFGPGLGFSRLIRIVGAALLMGIVVYLLNAANFFLVVGIAVMVYISIVWYSGAFSPEERTRLSSFVARRLRLRTA